MGLVYPELKDCPFCKGAVNWCALTPGEAHDCDHVECPTCGYFNPGVQPDIEGEAAEQYWARCLTAAAKTWNSRP